MFAKHLFSDMTGTVSKIVSDRSLKMYGKPCRYGVAYGNHKSKVFRLMLVGYMRVSSDCDRQTDRAPLPDPRLSQVFQPKV